MEYKKYVVLSLLVFQTSLTVTILRYLRTFTTSKPRYLSSTVVFLVEVIKAFSSLVIVFYQSSMYKVLEFFFYKILFGYFKIVMKCDYQ